MGKILFACMFVQNYVVLQSVLVWFAQPNANSKFVLLVIIIQLALLVQLTSETVFGQ